MPTPESSRRNLECARRNGRVKFWRTRSESQRVKAEIVLLHHTYRALSQRVIARTFHVSQPYVARLLKRVRVLGIERALGEACERYRAGMEAKRREHFQAVGGPASLTESSWQFKFEEPQPLEPLRCGVSVIEKVSETQYVELAQSTSGEVIEVLDSKPARTAPVYVPPPRTLTTRDIAAMGAGLSVADQCPGFGRR